MPRFSPFPGLRYDSSKAELSDVTAPPYDVIDEAEREKLAARHPRNIVRLDLPVGDDCYKRAGQDLAEWVAEGTLVRDPPSFYGYRMSWIDPDSGAGATTGVFGALELHRPGEGEILPHEHTTPKAKTDRLELLRGARANLSAVWGLSPAPGLASLIAPDTTTPTATWIDSGVTHELWVIDSPDQVKAIEDAVTSAPVVIADGHHRFETSLAYRDELGASGNDPAASLLAFVCELAPDELQVGPIHRLLRGLPPDALLDALEPWFEVIESPVPSTVAAMVEAEQLVLILPDRRLALRPRAAAFVGVRDLDTSRLDAALDGVEVAVTFQHGSDIAEAKVAAGEADAAVLVRPATVEQILDISHGGERMPPKTTFFWPKPRTGVVIRTLD